MHARKKLKVSKLIKNCDLSAPPIFDLSEQHRTKKLAVNLMLIDVSLQQPREDGDNEALDLSMVTSAA